MNGVFCAGSWRWTRAMGPFSHARVPLSQGGHVNRKQSAVLTALERVQRFLDDNAGRLTAANASSYRKVLDEVIGRLGGHGVDQKEHVRRSAGATAKRIAARQ